MKMTINGHVFFNKTFLTGILVQFWLYISFQFSCGSQIKKDSHEMWLLILLSIELKYVMRIKYGIFGLVSSFVAVKNVAFVIHLVSQASFS